MAAPPVSAAESRRNGSDFHAPALRNSSIDEIRKHGSFSSGSRKAGMQNREIHAYTAPSRETATVGNNRIRTPIHAAASR